MTLTTLIPQLKVAKLRQARAFSVSPPYLAGINPMRNNAGKCIPLQEQPVATYVVATTLGTMVILFSRGIALAIDLCIINKSDSTIACKIK